VSGAEPSLVPLSQPLVRGTVGQTLKPRDGARDKAGTIDLKALARKVLERDRTRDKVGTAVVSTCPTPPRAWDTCPTEWRDGFARLSIDRPPSYFPAPWWRGVIRDAQLFLSVWRRQAADLGWTALDLFGVHPKAPAARFSHMGLLLLVNGGRVVVITISARIRVPAVAACRSDATRTAAR
jgi:hypothetical protein